MANGVEVELRDRAPRSLTREFCTVSRHGGKQAIAVLCNVSDAGFCLETAADLRAGDAVELQILGVRIAGIIRWAKGDRAGGSFRDTVAIVPMT